MSSTSDGDGGISNGLVATGGGRELELERARQQLSGSLRSLGSTEQENEERKVGGSHGGNKGGLGNLEDSTAVVASLLHGMDQVGEGSAMQALPPTAPPTNEVLCVTVHCTDPLRASVNISHPVVRVSVVDGESGEYIKKSSEDRCVASFYERGNPSVDYILPIMTQPFDCRKHKYVRRLNLNMDSNEKCVHVFISRNGNGSGYIERSNAHTCSLKFEFTHTGRSTIICTII